MLSIQYSLRLGSSPSNPAYNTVFSPKFKVSFSLKPNQISTLGIRIAPELEKIGFKRNTCRAFVPVLDHVIIVVAAIRLRQLWASQ